MITVILGAILSGISASLLTSVNSVHDSTHFLNKRVAVWQANFDIASLVKTAKDIAVSDPTCAISARNLRTVGGVAFCMPKTRETACAPDSIYCLTTVAGQDIARYDGVLRAPAKAFAQNTPAKSGARENVFVFFPEAWAVGSGAPWLPNPNPAAAGTVSVPDCSISPGSDYCTVCGADANCYKVTICTDGTMTCDPSIAIPPGGTPNYVQPRYAFKTQN